MKTPRTFAVTPLSACLAVALPLWSGAVLAQSTFQASGACVVGADADGRISPMSTPKADQFVLPASSGAATASITGAPVDGWDATAGVATSASGDGQFGGSVYTANSIGSAASMSSTLSMAWSDQITNTSGNPDGVSAPLRTSSFTYEDVSEGWGCSLRQGSFGISCCGTTIGLGSVAAGETLGLRYVVDLGTETNVYGGGASVSFSDPSQIGSSGPASGRSLLGGASGSVAAVPEPETDAMMAAGLAAMGLVRRGRR